MINTKSFTVSGRKNVVDSDIFVDSTFSVIWVPEPFLLSLIRLFSFLDYQHNNNCDTMFIYEDD